VPEHADELTCFRSEGILCETCYHEVKDLYIHNPCDKRWGTSLFDPDGKRSTYRPDREAGFECQLGGRYTAPKEYQLGKGEKGKAFDAGAAFADVGGFFRRLSTSPPQTKGSRRGGAEQSLRDCANTPPNTYDKPFTFSHKVGSNGHQLKVSCPTFSDHWSEGTFVDRISEAQHVVFTPSYKRSDKALLNRGVFDIADLVTVVVVREDEFGAYKKRWGRDCVVIALDDVVQSIGATRQRILDIAHSLKLQWCWMLDDGIVPKTLTNSPRGDGASPVQMNLKEFLDALKKSHDGKVVVLSAASKYEPSMERDDPGTSSQ
jgi:hypothetical protein